MTTRVRLQCVDLVMVYPSPAGAVAALRGVDATFVEGTVSVVTGPSGAGKSTLLRLLAGLERPTAGDVVIDGLATARLGERRRRLLFTRNVGYVFQRPGDNLIEYLTVAQHLDLAARLRGVPRDPARTRETLAAYGLADAAAKRPRELSAGQQQQVAFVVASVGEPSLIIADEPSAELDDPARDQLIELIAAFASTGSTFAIASHDQNLVAVSQQIVHVERGATRVASETTGGPA